MKLTTFALCFTAFFFNVQADGIEDPYQTTCLGHLSGSYDWAACTNATRQTRTSCLCKQKDVLLTTIGCINLLADMYNRSHSDIAKKESYAALVTACKIQNDTLPALVKNATNLPAYEGVGTSKASYMQASPKTAFTVTNYEAKHAMIAYANIERIFDYKSQPYGKALMYYWYGLIVLRSIFYWSFNLFPSAFKFCDSKPVRLFRQYITLPATFRFRHSTKPILFKWFTLNIPTRLATLVVAGFCVLNTVFCFNDTGFHPGPNYFFHNDLMWQYSRYVSYRSGFLCMYILPVMFLFGGRNNFMIYMTGWPIDMFNVFHKWIGRVAMFDLLVHSAAYTEALIKNSRYISEWSLAYWSWGIVGFVFGCVMVFAGMHCFRRLSYEFFLWFHIFCAVWFVIGGYYHLKLLDEPLYYYWAVIAVWGFDRVARVLRIIASNPFAKATVTSHNSSVLELTVSYSKLWKAFPGSYTFVHIVQPTLFWESHPFSMMNCVADTEKGHLKFFCRVKDGMTRRLDKLALAKGGSFETHVWLDGLYGSYMNLKPFQEFLFVAGGIGIAAPFCQIQHLIAKGGSNISLYWGISDCQPLEWFKREIDFMLAHNVNVHMFISNGEGDSEKASLGSSENKVASVSSGEHKNQPKHDITSLSSSHSSAGVTPSARDQFTRVYRRMDAFDVVKEGIVSSKGPLAVLCCGPGGINDGCRKSVADNLNKTPNYVEYFEESFSW